MDILDVATTDDANLMSTKLTIVFPAESMNEIRCRRITIRDDELLEGDEEFTVTITEAGPYALINSSSSLTTVTIGDNEGKLYTMYIAIHRLK